MTESQNPYLEVRPLPKYIKYTDKAYLKWIDGQPCLECGKPSTHCHVRREYWGAGVGTKSHDYCAIQLCPIHNTYELERKWGTDRLIAENLMRYLHEVLR